MDGNPSAAQLASEPAKPRGQSQAARPLVSIVLPTYNGARYLRESIESVLAQTYENWELIIVDDCSKDATPDIIAEYARRDSRIRGIRHEVNKKLPGGLNTGHDAARGAYLSWTSDDNRFLPTAVQEMLDYLEKHPQVGLVYTECLIIDESGQYVRDYDIEPPETLAWTNIVGACFLYRRSVYEAVGPYDDQMFLAEDYDFWLRVYRQFELVPLHRKLYEYRAHGQSLSQTKQTAVLDSMDRTLRRHLPHLSRASRKARARGWMVCTSVALRRRAPLRAMTAYSRALATAPIFSLRQLARKLLRRDDQELLARKLPA